MGLCLVSDSLPSPDNRLEDDLVFEDSFNPQQAPTSVPQTTVEEASLKKVKPESHDQVADTSDSAAAPGPSGDRISPSVPVKVEPASPVGIVREQEQASSDTKPLPEDLINNEGSGKAGGIRLGKRPAGERVNEFMECMAKVKRESSEDVSTIVLKDTGAVDKGFKPKKQKRYEKVGRWIGGLMCQARPFLFCFFFIDRNMMQYTRLLLMHIMSLRNPELQGWYVFLTRKTNSW